MRGLMGPPSLGLRDHFLGISMETGWMAGLVKDRDGRRRVELLALKALRP